MYIVFTRSHTDINRSAIERSILFRLGKTTIESIRRKLIFVKFTSF